MTKDQKDQRTDPISQNSYGCQQGSNTCEEIHILESCSVSINKIFDIQFRLKPFFSYPDKVHFFSTIFVIFLNVSLLAVEMPTPQNGQTHLKKLLTTADRLLSGFDHIVGLVLTALKCLSSVSVNYHLETPCLFTWFTLKTT